MPLIRELQQEHRSWLAHNFPNQGTIDPFLGMVEEVGELAHALLKYKQGIRGHAAGEVDRYSDAIIDGLGDLFIFMLSFSNSHNLDLESAIIKTWQKVQQRDWVNDPEQGGE